MHGRRSQNPHLEGPFDFAPHAKRPLFLSSSPEKMETQQNRSTDPSTSTSNPTSNPNSNPSTQNPTTSNFPHLELPNLELPHTQHQDPLPDLLKLMADQINKLNSNQQTLTRNIQNLANPRPNPPPRQQPVVPLKDFYDPSYYEERPGVVIPEGDFEIKPAVLNLIKHFHGLPREDPFSHLEELTLLAQTTRSRNVQEDIWLMRLFPLSLKDKAAYWFRTIGRPITTWPQLKSAFLKKFFPIGPTNSLRRSITTFHQKSGETFHDSWERFQDLLRSCPHHEIPLWQLVQIFYHGLEDQIRQFVDASCGGNFLNKDAESAYDLFEEMSEN